MHCSIIPHVFVYMTCFFNISNITSIIIEQEQRHLITQTVAKKKRFYAKLNLHYFSHCWSCYSRYISSRVTVEDFQRANAFLRVLNLFFVFKHTFCHALKYSASMFPTFLRSSELKKNPEGGLHLSHRIHFKPKRNDTSLGQICLPKKKTHRQTERE